MLFKYVYLWRWSILVKYMLKQESYIYLFNTIYCNRLIFSPQIHLTTYIKLNKYVLNFKFRTFCIFTNKQSSIYKLLSLSRMHIKMFNNKGYLPGISQASW